MIERLKNPALLGTAAAAAIAVGNFLTPTAEAGAQEAEAARPADEAAWTRVGGHAVKQVTGGTPADRVPTGCTSADGAVVTSGSRGSNEVALTFDDGPSLKYTPRILEILDRFNVPATFYVEGKHVKGREGMLAGMLAEGHEIANHTYNHPAYPGYNQLKRTNQAIKRVTGFEPCHFRPPYGLLDGGTISAAARLGMDVVLWDVESLDSKHPGASTIRANVVNQAHGGSNILLHDGGKHPQTVRALPGIIRGLKHRGFDFVTTTDLLGGRFLYR